MAAAMAAASASAASATLVNPLPLRRSLCSSSISIGTQHRGRGLCFNSLVSRPGTRNAAVCGSRRLRYRTFALAEQQASQAEQVEDEKEKADDDGLEDTTSQVNGSEPTEVSASVIEVLLRNYSEAVLGNDQAAMSTIQAELEVIQKERDSLSQLVANLTEESALAKERLLRLNADFDNFRKRSGREKDSLRETVKGDVVESLLPMIDNFERAKGAIKAETDGERKIDSSYQGIYKQFVDIMKSLGVKVIDTVGKEFNPELHEAIMREESSEYDEGIVTQEFRRGFLLGEKLLRAAMVKVSSGKPSNSPAAAPQDSEETTPSDETPVDENSA
ncbi:uncharacterized protein LOC9635682 [Selaginella moellendorffii]|nr:uncharacterized protein LOC9635682 [Selaginella moellendorffii]|eukprot:XP_002965873.2 uncharacterized protein LOC9635682 [Selaginella moellendorffii]